MATLLGTVAIDTGRSSSPTSPVATTTTLAVPSGNSIIISILSYGTTVTSVVDSAGNTYTRDINFADSYASSGYIYSKHNCATLVSGGTIIVTLSGPPTAYALIATSWSGVSPTTPKDVTATGLGTTSVSTSVSSATAENNELVISTGIVFSYTSSLWSAGTGYSANATAVYTYSGFPYSLFQQYKIANLAGTQQATASAPTPFGQSGLCLVTYKSGSTGPTASLSIVSTSNLSFTPSLNVPPPQPIAIRSSIVDSMTVISSVQTSR